MDYKINLELVNNVDLSIYQFNNKDHRWILEHSYSNPYNPNPAKRVKPIITINYRIIINYARGIIQDMELTMEVTRHDRRGHEFFAGIDISQNSKAFFQFFYKVKEKVLKLSRIETTEGKFDLEKEGAQPVKLRNYPFPLLESIENVYGIYEVPYMNLLLQESHVSIPHRYDQKS